MKVVEPIRDTDDIERIKDFLKRKNERDYVLFLFGIYTGLRVSDIIPIKVKQIMRNKIEIRQNMKKLKEIKISNYKNIGHQVVGFDTISNFNILVGQNRKIYTPTIS